MGICVRRRRDIAGAPALPAWPQGSPTGNCLLQVLGQPPLTRSVSAVRAWEMVAGKCREYGCKLIVIENADLLDRNSLAVVSDRNLPAVILVGSERLAQQISRNTAYTRQILEWEAGLSAFLG